MDKNNVVRITPRTLLLPTVLILQLVTHADASPVLAGIDYWKLNEGDGQVSFTLGAYGTISFEDNFTGLSPTTNQSYSIAIERLANSTLTGGAGCAGPADPAEPYCAIIEEIPIIMRSFDLKSVGIVDVGGKSYNVSLGLDPTMDTLGTLDLQHKWADGEVPGIDGTNWGYLWDNIFLRAEFNEIGGPDSFYVNGSTGNVVYDFETSWMHGPDGAFLSANASWAPLGPGSFSINETVQVTQVDSAVVPAPAAAWLFCSGLAGLISLAKRKRPQQHQAG